MKKDMRTMTFKELAIEILEKSGKPLSSQEIWDQANKLGYVGTEFISNGKTPLLTLQSIIYTEIKDNGDSSKFVKVTSRPTLFGLRDKEYGNIDEVVREEIIKQETVGGEKDDNNKYEKELHPFLTAFVADHPNFRCKTMTIRHEVSGRKTSGKNIWIHPDIVGVRMPFEDYCEDTIKFMNELSINTCKLFSFEMKLSLTTGDLRKSFFQAVSNSSWANEGYLVAAKYAENEDFENEMRMLNEAFGIGFIELDIENLNHKVRLAARPNNKLDLNMIDRLYKGNEDFVKFANNIEHNLKLEKPVVIGNYDKVYNSDVLKEKGKDIKI